MIQYVLHLGRGIQLAVPPRDGADPCFSITVDAGNLSKGDGDAHRIRKPGGEVLMDYKPQSGGSFSFDEHLSPSGPKVIRRGYLRVR
jgi:hypothetical protein